MEDLSLHILDIAENAIRAHATQIEISVREEEEHHRLTVRIRDNGEGMSEQALAQACDPFFTTKSGKRVGLGLPLLRQSAEETGGQLHVRSSPGEGTEVTAVFDTSQADMRPLGDVLETIAALITASPSVRLLADVRTGEHAFHFDSWTGQTKRIS